MNQLPTFIEYLLLGHDYVVIPGLGTFIVQQMAARRNEEEEAFLPPYRSVRFNTELKYGDDLLVNAIEKLHKCTRNQAEQKLVTWVNEFTQTLEDTGYADFGAWVPSHRRKHKVFTSLPRKQVSPLPIFMD